MTNILASRRARLVAVMVAATAVISVAAFQAAGASISYYMEPHEYLSKPELEGTRVRVAGRVAPGSVTEVAGRPVEFQIMGDYDDYVTVSYEEGVVPNLFGPYALVVVEGTALSGGRVEARNLIIKHEDEFFADRPPPDSISSHFVDPTPTPAAGE